MIPLEEAAGALEEYPLRAGDAVHLASIRRMRRTANDPTDSLVVIGSNQELMQACRSLESLR